MTEANQNTNERIEKSEIINQKLRFLFNVESDTHNVFPNEKFTFYIFVKNISSVDINNFNIKIINEDNISIEKTDESSITTIKANSTELYVLKAKCPYLGKYTVHFVGYGDETELLYKTLQINCSYNSEHEELTHKIQIYDFTPYETNYTLEADNFSSEVTQIFKRQKLPYPYNTPNAESKKFPMLNQMIIGEESGTLEKDWYEENIESESYIQQNKVAKNTNEYHYQYISRENFSESGAESFTGKNLIELAEDINKNSNYFRAKFLRSGTNILLNDFNQYNPNGLLYRLGLLTSELYHTLGVIPEYDYMGDYLFRWAPSLNQLPNFYPQKQGMKWDENIWAGKGWNVYRSATSEYMETDEYKEKAQQGKVSSWVFLDNFLEEQTAKEYVEKLKYADNIIRAQERSDVIKYEYIIEESLLDNGIFFINIPIAKIPSNFILPDEEELSAIINRTKPFGEKAIIRYVINETFNQNMEFFAKPNYYLQDNFNLENMNFSYQICSKKIEPVLLKCGNEQIQSINEIVDKCELFDIDKNFFNEEIDFALNINRKTKNVFDSDIDLDYSIIHDFIPDNSLTKLEEILELLYQKNYNNIAFSTNIRLIDKLSTEELKKADNIKKAKFFENPIEIELKDNNNITHKITYEKDEYYNMHRIKNIIIDKNDKEEVIYEGLQKIKSVIAYIDEVFDKTIIIWFVKDEQSTIHYFNHEIVSKIDKSKYKNKYNMFIVSVADIFFETPFIYKEKKITPIFDNENTNWKNLYRFNTVDNTYSYIENFTKDIITPDDVKYLFNNINLPETSIIKEGHLRLVSSSKNKNIYLYNSFNTNYLDENATSHYLCLNPTKIEVYPTRLESTDYYEEKIQEAINDNNKIAKEKYQSLFEESSLFNESVNVSLAQLNNYIDIKKPFWFEVSNFTNDIFKLNETQNIELIIEGYNTEEETTITTQTLSHTNFANQTRTEEIPSGYFRKKIDLYYPNSFYTNLLKVRFKFNELHHSIKIFDIKLNINFKQKQDYEIPWEYLTTINESGESNIVLFEDLNSAYTLNNGLGISFSFDDVRFSEYYNLNALELCILYKETDMEILINKDKYRYEPNNVRANTLTGKVSGYPSIEFYNDIVSMGQNLSNIGPRNNGIELRDTLMQSFYTREDNITSIEIFPNGFYGNPDEFLKISLYENRGNTPGKLIKETYANGWVKNQTDLKDLPSIKYNLNVDNLKINEMYWLEIQVMNPRENSYYLLKSIDETQKDFKLLKNENNNYINTFSCLKFNIYSKNLSRTFAQIPCLQETFDNPYILVGLHKNQGKISDLKVNLQREFVFGNDYMSDNFDENPELILRKIIIKDVDGNEINRNENEE